ncbi:hypothetical protein LPJ73_004763, partial [Coemansia sp. RSA 2703]
MYRRALLQTLGFTADRSLLLPTTFVRPRIGQSLATFQQQRGIAAYTLGPLFPKQHRYLPVTHALRHYATQRRKKPVVTTPSPPPPVQQQQQQQPLSTRNDPTLPGQTLTFIQKIKGFVSFYKSGLKELISNLRAASAIRTRIENGQAITRDEYQIVRRSPSDKLRLIPFGFLVLVIPELIPLTIWLFPNMCPTTCRTFSQVVKMAKKQDEIRQNIHILALERIQLLGLSPEEFMRDAGIASLQQRNMDIFSLERASGSDLQMLCAFMGISVKGGARAEALRQHLEYLRHDDQLLVRDKLVDLLGLSELHRACQERGIPSAGYSEDHLRIALHSWMRQSAGGKADIASLVPIVWRYTLFACKALATPVRVSDNLELPSLVSEKFDMPVKVSERLEIPESALSAAQTEQQQQQFTGMMPDELSSWMQDKSVRAAETQQHEGDVITQVVFEFTGMQPEQMSTWIAEQEMHSNTAIREAPLDAEAVSAQEESIEALRTAEFISDIVFVLETP